MCEHQDSFVKRDREKRNTELFVYGRLPILVVVDLDVDADDNRSFARRSWSATRL